jgi:phosphate-selective porin OprO and OprP
VAAALSAATWAAVMRWPFTLGVLLLSLSHRATVLGQQPTRTPGDTTPPIEHAGEAGEDPVRRNHLRRPVFDLGFTTFHVGVGLLVDFSSYAQNDESRAQIDNMEPGFKVRDTRLMFGGRFKTKRPLTWQAGVMYDGKTDSWFVRQTGLMVAVPELWGSVFIGRAKEGVSLNKVMVGYDGWTLERFTFSDAIPLLADGIKWLGYLPDKHLLWNVGWFTDWLSEGQSFSTYDNQVTVRAAWVPMMADSVGTLLHIGINARTGKLNEGQMQLRSRPEDSAAPYFLDTGKFPASHSQMVGVEAYYRPGAWLFSSEYYVQTVDARDTSDPLFHGGDVSVLWLITGETRSYNTVGGYFRSVSPAKTIVDRGPGAWEAVLRYSYSDYTDGAIEGGKFWRITPMVNWYLTDNARLEIAYGYGTLDRFDRKGATQFFQSRLQLEF